MSLLAQSSVVKSFKFKAMQQKAKNVIGGHRDRHERGGCPPSLKHGFID